MSADDHESLIKQVIEICQTDENTAKSFLELFNWNLSDAVENILINQDENPVPGIDTEYSEMISGSNSNPGQTEASSFHGINPMPNVRDSSHRSVATLSSIAGNSPHNPDSDDENAQAFYVGGAEHGGGGQQVLGPPRPHNPESFVQGIFRAAQDGGAEVLDRVRVSDHLADNVAQEQPFVGTGYRLGESLSDPLVKVPGKPSSTKNVGSRSKEEEAEEEESVVVKMWEDGFSLDDGPLRSYTAPESLEFIVAVKQGRIPPELLKTHRNREVHLLLEDHYNETYQAPPTPKVKAFSGAGRLLGNPTPAVVSAPPPPPSLPQQCSSLPCPQVDDSKPTTQIQVRMPDGSRLVVTLNHQHTVQDLRSAIISQRPDLSDQSFDLLTTFPRRDLTDPSSTLAGANLLNAAIVVTRH